jgi:hypothetical protein
MKNKKIQKSGVSVIIFNEDGVSFEDKVFSVYSILKSALFLKIKAQLFFLTEDKDEIKEILIATGLDYSECYPVKIKSLGETFNEAIRRSHGRIIFLTTTSCVVPEDWLSKSLSIYFAESEIVSVGGYVYKKKRYTLLDEYEYFLLGSKLRLDISKSKYLTYLYDTAKLNLYQNPCGTIKNISYSRSVFIENVIDWGNIHTLEKLEEVIRSYAFKSGYVFFTHLRVIDLEKMNLKIFIKKHFNYGVSGYEISHNTHTLINRYSHPIISTGKEIKLNLIFGYWKVKLTGIIILAGLCHFFGYYFSLMNYFFLSFKTGKNTESA